MAISSNPQQPSSSIGVVELPSFPMSGRQAVQLYGAQGLTDYEKIEVRNYQDVYFLGLSATKMKGSTLHQHNFGYDDERGDY
jgi:dual specificity tyrosine-phosphorylation-regulated kinase 2/3/4